MLLRDARRIEEIRFTFTNWIIGLSLLFVAAPVFAHHSFMKEFDMKKPITLNATVTKVDWSNPHINFWADVKDEKGAVTNWAFQSASPTVTREGRLGPRDAESGGSNYYRRLSGEGWKPYATTRL